MLFLVHLSTINFAMNDVSDNGAILRSLIADSGLTQAEALALVNRGQAFPIALSTWKAYLAAPDSTRRRMCPDNVIAHAKKTIKKNSTRN